MLPTTVKSNRYTLGNSLETKIKVTLVTGLKLLAFQSLARGSSALGEGLFSQQPFADQPTTHCGTGSLRESKNEQI